MTTITFVRNRPCFIRIHLMTSTVCTLVLVAVAIMASGGSSAPVRQGLGCAGGGWAGTVPFFSAIGDPPSDPIWRTSARSTRQRPPNRVQGAVNRPLVRLSRTEISPRAPIEMFWLGGGSPWTRVRRLQHPKTAPDAVFHECTSSLVQGAANTPGITPSARLSRTQILPLATIEMIWLGGSAPSTRAPPPHHLKHHPRHCFAGMHICIYKYVCACMCMYVYVLYVSCLYQRCMCMYCMCW